MSKPKPSTPEPHAPVEDRLDEALDETFPASDPIAVDPEEEPAEHPTKEKKRHSARITRATPSSFRSVGQRQGSNNNVLTDIGLTTAVSAVVAAWESVSRRASPQAGQVSAE